MEALATKYTNNKSTCMHMVVWKIHCYIPHMQPYASLSVTRYIWWHNITACTVLWWGLSPCLCILSASVSIQQFLQMLDFKAFGV